MNSEHQGVALQAVEFWSTVCDEELELQEEANEAFEVGEQPERVSFDFAKTAAPEILPVLLWMLTQQVSTKSLIVVCMLLLTTFFPYFST